MSFTRQPGSVKELGDALAALSHFTAAQLTALQTGVASPEELTAVDDSTVDTTYGQQEADVISSLVVSVGEIQALLVALGFAEMAE